MPRFPRLSIASQLYAIFALLATATVVLALVAVVTARRHAALTDEFELALQGSQNVERINGLIYAVVMESRGVYMSEDAPSRKKYADGLLNFNGQIAQIINAWERTVGPEYADQFKPFADGSPVHPNSARSWRGSASRSARPLGREWGDNDANRTVRIALNKDLNRLARSTSRRGTPTRRSTSASASPPG
jgi:methyl-accepting chemotaxis protein